MAYSRCWASLGARFCVVALALASQGDASRIAKPSPALSALAAAPSQADPPSLAAAISQAAPLAAAPVAPLQASGASALKSDPEVLLALGVSTVLYGVVVLVALAALGILVCCLYDLGRSWWHHAHYRACERKLRRVHEAFLKHRCELPLCPFCVEPLTRQASTSKVVFLCGHRFHISCANAWFRENPANATRCPICVEPDGSSLAGKAGVVAELTDEEMAGADSGDVDEAQNFILRSLHLRYPEFIPEASVRRWQHCGTELWLQELTCPGYNSFLKQLTQGDCGVCGVDGGAVEACGGCTTAAKK